MNINYRYVGENVRSARLNKGLTIEQLAELADISDSFLGVAERGTSGFSIETIIKLARVLGVTTDSLLLENVQGRGSSSKADTLAAILAGCTEDEIAFMIEYVKLCKKMGIFKAAKP
ncbi:MAG: helix-turn-helix domain-containing protein [Clostridiales bacterium]|nr:helix-turn-helix domain-containing protein [Clostridiales bacterium]